MPQINRDSVSGRQEPLRRRYREAPETAWVQDHARAVIGDATDPFHGAVEPANNGEAHWAYGLHRAMGGDHDAPNPGDLLCTALAACLHSSTRMLAAWVGVAVLDIEVAATAEIDVRGALMVDPAVPVNFQRMHCDVCLEVPAATDGSSLKALMTSAEQSCAVMQTLARGIEVTTDWHIEQELDDGPNPGQDAMTSKEVRHD